MSGDSNKANMGNWSVIKFPSFYVLEFMLPIEGSVIIVNPGINNTKLHNCVVVVAKFNESHYELILHSSDSPDLAPSELFPVSKFEEVDWKDKIWPSYEIIPQTYVFWGSYRISLFETGENIREILNEVYETQRGPS